jgi:acyl carrier protein
MKSFSVDEASAEKLEYNAIPAWDSLGHMGLMAELEEAFGIQMEMDDIIDFSSYKKGMELVSKYGVQF